MRPGPATVRLVDVEARAVRRVCHGHSGGVFDLAFDPRTGLIASASHDYSAVLWEVEGQDDAITLLGDVVGISRHCVAFHGSRVLVGDGETFAGKRASLTAIDLDDGRERVLINLDDARGIRAMGVLHSDGRVVAAIDRIRDTTRSTEIRVVSVDGTETARWTVAATVCDLVVLEGDRFAILTGGWDTEDNEVSEIVLWSAAGERIGASRVPGASYGTLASSPRGDSFVIGYEHVLEIRDPETLAPTASFAVRSEVTAVAWSTTGMIAAGTIEGTLRLFDCATGVERL